MAFCALSADAFMCRAVITVDVSYCSSELQNPQILMLTL